MFRFDLKMSSKEERENYETEIKGRLERSITLLKSSNRDDIDLAKILIGDYHKELRDRDKIYTNSVGLWRLNSIFYSAINGTYKFSSRSEYIEFIKDIKGKEIHFSLIRNNLDSMAKPFDNLCCSNCWERINTMIKHCLTDIKDIKSLSISDFKYIPNMILLGIDSTDCGLVYSYSIYSGSESAFLNVMLPS